MSQNKSEHFMNHAVLIVLVGDKYGINLRVNVH